MADDKDLAKRLFNAASWSMIVQFAGQFVQLFLSVLIVRLLSPADYGIIGMLTIIWSVSNIFIYGGFSNALLQRKEITQYDSCSVCNRSRLKQRRSLRFCEITLE